MIEPFGIDIQFFPFNVKSFDRAEPVQVGLQDLPDVEWCSLPDILLESTTRKFVGLSFAVDFGKELVAKRLCSDLKHLRLLQCTDEEFLARYQGFGGGSRFEMIWATAKLIDCEPASLSDGYWLGIENRGVLMPCGYRLLGISDLLADHALKYPVS
jgi:hypothetical protein